MKSTFGVVVFIGAAFAIIAIIFYAVSVGYLMWMFWDASYAKLMPEAGEDAPKAVTKWAAQLEVVKALGGLATVAAAAAGGFLIQEPLKKALRDQAHSLERQNAGLQVQLDTAMAQVRSQATGS